MPQPDLYKILGVDKKASPEEIKKAHRRLVRKHHPDRNPGDEKAEERFKEIQAAYDVLGDTEKRKQYDRGGLFGVFLVLSGAGAVRHFSDKDFHGKRPVMIGSHLGDRAVARNPKTAGLGMFQELALEILVFNFHDPPLERPPYCFFDECSRVIETCIEVDRPDERLVGVGQDCLHTLPSRLERARTHKHEIGEAELVRVGRESLMIDEPGAHFRQLTFRRRVVAAIKILRHGEIEDRIAEKFEPLVRDGILFMRNLEIGTVGEGLKKQLLIADGIVQAAFQLSKIDSWCGCAGLENLR